MRSPLTSHAASVAIEPEPPGMVTRIWSVLGAVAVTPEPAKVSLVTAVVRLADSSTTSMFEPPAWAAHDMSVPSDVRT